MMSAAREIKEAKMSIHLSAMYDQKALRMIAL